MKKPSNTDALGQKGRAQGKSAYGIGDAYKQGGAYMQRNIYRWEGVEWWKWFGRREN